MRSSFLLLPVLLVACASAGGADSNDPGAQGGAGGGGSGGAVAGSGLGGSQAGSSGASTAGSAGVSSAGSAGASAGNPGAGNAGAAGSEAAGQGGEAGTSAEGGSNSGGVGGDGGSNPGGGAGAGGDGGDPFGGGGGPEAKCETAAQYAVGPEQPVQVSGDTSSLSNYFGAYCDSVGAPGKDTAYKIIPKVNGTVIVHLAAENSGYDPVLSVTSSECTVFVTNTDGSCANYSGVGGAEELEVKVTQDTPFWVYVDGEKGADGAYSLSIAYAGSGGSGGSGQAGTGGSSGSGGSGQGGGSGGSSSGSGGSGQAGSGGAPTIEGQSCSDPVKVQVGKGEPLVVTGSTELDKNNFLGYCNINGDQRDLVYEVTALAAGQLVAKLEPLSDTLDVALYAHKDECSSVLFASDTNGGMGACRELFGPGVAETLDPLVVTAGSKTYVYVDTNESNGIKGGPYRLTVTLQ